MRRLALVLLMLLLAAVPAVVVAGCGGDDAGSSSGLDEVLGYLPENAPFAIVISTDPDGEQFKNLDAIVDKFPFSDQLKQQLQQSLSQQQVDFDNDLKPLLGNPFVVGVTDAKDAVNRGETNSFVGAIQVEDKDKLDELIKKGGELREAGEVKGATVYEGNGQATAVKDDVVIFANDRQRLEAALDQRENDNRLDEDKFNEAMGDLPDDALVRFYGDLEQLLKADPGNADALKVKWVAALRKMGLTASAEKDGIKLDFDLGTDSEGLTDADLPMATGPESPSVVKRKGEISMALRGASQVFKFGQSAAQAVDPSGFGQFATAKRQINEQLGIDIDKDIVDQFSGEAAITFDGRGGFGLRAQPQDPAAMEKTLETLAERAPSAARKLGAGTIGIAKPRAGEDFYAVATEDERFVMGVVNDVFVLSDDAERASALATAQPEKVGGAKGALVLSADAEELAQKALEGRLQGAQALGAGLFTAPLGEVVSWAEIDTEGLRGTARLGIDG